MGDIFVAQAIINKINTMEDNHVMNHIKSLTAKEEELYAKDNLSAEDVKKLDQVKAELDQYWDLLRQRRALRSAGESPGQAEIRPSDQINNYER